MKKYIAAVLILVSLTLAAIAYFAFDSSLVATIFAAWALMAWAFFGGESEDLPVVQGKPDPKELKAYRKLHPEASIVDAIRATGKGAQS